MVFLMTLPGHYLVFGIYLHMESFCFSGFQLVLYLGCSFIPPYSTYYGMALDGDF